MDCNEVQPLLAARALGALDESEKASVDGHLTSCSSCQADYAAERETVARLPFIATLVDPPASLKTRLMARIDALTGEGETSRPSAATPSSRRRRRLFVLSGQRHRPLRSLALATMAVALSFVGWAVFQTARVNDLTAQNENLTTTVKNQWNAISLAVDPKVQSVPVSASEGSPRTHGSLLVNKEQRQAALVVVDLSPPKRGQVYQVWLWDPTSGTLQTVGTFRTWAGYGMWTFQPPVPESGELRFGVSREPEGGSPAPTSPMVLTGSLSPKAE